VVMGAPSVVERTACTLATLADCFGRLHDRGLLYAPESSLAAEHFAFLMVGKPIDEALFYGGPEVLASIDPARYVGAGVEVFLAGYRARPGPR
jgi:TetR/AcrR family transcriptional repressor of mexJK operon